MQKPPEGWPRIAPSLFYEDAAAAIDWLVNAFGFEVQVRVENERGQIVHSQLVMNGGLIMIGQAGLSPDRPYCKSPRGVDGANTQALAVFVDGRRRPLRARPGGGRRHRDRAVHPGLRRGLLGRPHLPGPRPRRPPLVVHAAPAGLTRPAARPTAPRRS